MGVRSRTDYGLQANRDGHFLHCPSSLRRSKATGIGKAFGCATWIVDQDDTINWCPRERIGELLIRGKGLSRRPSGYLGQRQREDGRGVHFRGAPTSEFIPEASRGSYMFYKSGDLCHVPRR